MTTEEIELDLQDKKLSTAKRKKLKKTSFAIPSKRPGSGSYPIPDISHGRAALRMVAAHGTPSEKKRVKAKVYKKYPSLKKGSKRR